jgi:2-aminoadipate transaminase
MMAQAKQANDLHSNSLSQQALYQLCTHYDLDAHIKHLIQVYRARMEVMVTCIEQAGLPNVYFVKPKGGMFLWVEVDKAINTTTLLNDAVSNGVAYVPGEPFFAGKPKQNTMRLNFTHSRPDKIEQGMNLLIQVLSKEMEQRLVKIGK